MLNDRCRAEDLDLPPWRNEPQRAVGEADVPVGLRSRRHRRRVVRSVGPDRVDLEQRGNQHDHAEDDEEESTGLRCEHRHDRHTDDVVVGAAGAGELGVLVDDQQQHVHAERGDQNGGQQQDVQNVESPDDVRAGELAAEQQVRDPGSDDRDALDHAVDDAKAVAREQIVGKRVAGEAFGHREDEQHETDHPVDLTRLAERAGEEDAQHVQADGCHEQQRCPVVHLAHQQATADVEREVERRGHRRRHLDALQRHVGAVVVDLDHRRLEEEGQERAREQDDDEAVQRDLAEHERPVVGEDLAPELLDDARHAGALVDVVGCPAGEACPRSFCTGDGRAVLGGGHSVRSQKLGPTGSVKSLRGDEVALVVDGDGQLGQRALGRSEDDRRLLGDVELRLVARAEQVVRLLLVQGHRASDVRADLRVRDDAVVGPVFAAGGDVEVFGLEAHQQHGGLGLLLELVLRLVRDPPG